ncbi:MAG: hypothetical protein WBB27_19565, partial [Maribacter sp.]
MNGICNELVEVLKLYLAKDYKDYKELNLRMIKLIERIPLIGPIAILIKNKIFPPKKSFTNSREYWADRYQKGGNSGAGSYNKLAEFKGEIINDFVSKNNIKTVIELGFGDGNQLEYFQFPSYIG